MQLRKTIKDTVLKALSDNGGQNVKLTTVLLPFDSNRTDIKGVLFSLEEDRLIKIDRDYNRLTTKSAGQYYTIGSITLIARLTPTGESYYKEHYEKKEVLGTVKNENQLTTKLSNNIIYPVIVGLIIIIITIILKYAFDISF